MLIELNCFLGGVYSVFVVARQPRSPSPSRGDTYLPTRSGGAKETMLIKRRDNWLFSQMTPGSFRRPDCFASDFVARRAMLIQRTTSQRTSLPRELARTVIVFLKDAEQASVLH